MPYVILLDLQNVFFLINFVIKSFLKIFIRCLAMSYILIYYITIISKTLNKIANCMKLEVVED